MNKHNPVETLAKALYSCLENKNYLPDISYQWQSPQDRKAGLPESTHYRRPEVEDVHVFHFPQTWGSTALGFGGIAGAALTTAYTTVIIDPYKNGAVFFNGKYAYTIIGYNESFEKDCHAQQMASVNESLIKYNDKHF